MHLSGTHILCLSCPDRIGIVAGVAGYLSQHGCNIEDAQQFSDHTTGRFFMRVVVSVPDGQAPALTSGFSALASSFAMAWALHDLSRRPRVLIMVSAFDHCLNDLLYRASIGALPVDITAIVSNHPDAGRLSAHYGLPFHHLPVAPSTKGPQEQALLRLITDTATDLVVLARYMQILSPDFSTALAGRIINIHHSFLPSFKGARPYQQAFARGVKLIGATAHYVTADLDEGPIIEQDVARVDHAMRVEDFIAIGREIEARVLARAIASHASHRVFLNGVRTVVFR